MCLPVLLEFDGLVAADGGGGCRAAAPLEAIPVLVAAQMTSPLPAAAVPQAAVLKARAPRKMQQHLVLGTVSAVTR